MKMLVNYDGKQYYCNGYKPVEDQEYMRFTARRRAVEEVDYFHAKRKSFFFNGDLLTNGFGDLVWCAQMFNAITQPSENEVRKALIKTLAINTGDGVSEKYMLKAGGGTASDSIYISSFSMLTSDAKTGYDKWVVVMKKYSTDFSDVLITYKELYSLLELCADPIHIEARDYEFCVDYLKHITRATRENAIETNSGKKGNEFNLQQAANVLQNKIANQNILTRALNELTSNWQQDIEELLSKASLKEGEVKRLSIAHHSVKVLKKMNSLLFPQGEMPVIIAKPKVLAIQTSIFA